MSSSDASRGQYPFSDVDLARRLERAEANAGIRFVESRARYIPQSGAEWREIAGAYALYDGADSPVTQTFGLGLFADITGAELEQVEAFFDERGAPVVHEISPMAGIPLMALLSERGYHPIELTSVLYRPCQGGGIHNPHGDAWQRIKVRPIGEEEQALWAQTAAKGWSQAADSPFFLGVIRNLVAQRENALALIAEIDGQPIATAALSFHAGMALMAGASTIPEARRQGAQLALLDARLRFAEERGCDLVMMGAEPGSASQRNAERHGFRIAYTRIKWSRAAHPG